MNTFAEIDIQIKAEPERAVDFFISLYKAKKNKGKVPSDFHLPENFDLKTITELKPTKEALQQAEINIKALYDFLSGIEQIGSYKKFKYDSFTKDLKEEIILFLICKRMLSSNKISLFEIGMSLTAEVFRQMGMDTISEVFTRQMLLIYLKTITQNKDYSFKAGIPKEDAFELNSTYFDQHYYYEKEGIMIPFTEQTSPDCFLDYYIQKGNDVVRCKTNADDEVMEITIFQQATIQDQKLITASPKNIAETLYIPSNESASFFAGLNGDILESEEEVLSNLSSDNRNENSIPVASYIEAFHRYTSFINLEDKEAKQALSDRCIFHFYRMVKSGFLSLSASDLNVVTGYVCSLIGVLDDGKKFNKEAAFFEYLEDSVQKVLNRNS